MSIIYNESVTETQLGSLAHNRHLKRVMLYCQGDGGLSVETNQISGALLQELGKHCANIEHFGRPGWFELGLR